MFSTHDDALSPARRSIGTALIALTGFILAASSVTKFAGLPPVVHQLEGFGFGGTIALLGIIEATTAVLFLVPRTRALGLLLFSAFMGGAIATPSLAMSGLWLLVTVVGSVFVVRVFGIVSDGTVAQSRPVLAAEAILLALVTGALVLGRAARSHPAPA